MMGHCRRVLNVVQARMLLPIIGGAPAYLVQARVLPPITGALGSRHPHREQVTVDSRRALRLKLSAGKDDENWLGLH